MASDRQLCELFQEFRKELGNFIHQDDLMEVNFEFELEPYFFREDIDGMKKHISRMRECLETIREGLE